MKLIPIGQEYPCGEGVLYHRRPRRAWSMVARGDLVK